MSERIIVIEEGVGAFGTDVSNVGGDFYQKLQGRGASVSAFPGGVNAHEAAKQPMKFEAIEIFDDGMMQRVVPYGPGNPAPLLEPPIEAPLPLPEAVSVAPGFQALPLTAEPEVVVLGAPVQGPSSVTPINPRVVSSAPSDELKITEQVEFVIPNIGRFKFGCYTVDASDTLLTLIGTDFPNIEPSQTINIEVRGQIRNCFSLGINVPIRLGKYSAKITHFMFVPNES